MGCFRSSMEAASRPEFAILVLIRQINMARWIYQRPVECCDPTELIVATRLALLSDDWVIRWGFYYDSDREGDFLILGPIGGVLVLEVKGGALRKLSSTGRWEGPERDHPMNQLCAEWKAVLAQLQQTADSNAVPFVAKALCLADLTIDPKTPYYKEIDRNLIVDRGDLAAFETTWDRLFPRRHPVPEEERKVFLKSYAKDISPKEIKHFVGETDRILLRQTTAEYQILDMLRDNRQLVVQGGPGSGKTWLALEQAFRYAKEGLRVLFLCYNIALADHLSALVAKRKLKKGEVVVRSWAALARELLETAGLEWDEPTGLTESDLYFGEVVPSLMREIALDQQFAPRFDALVVDEAQDQNTSWRESESDEAASGWWEVYWRLLRESLAGCSQIGEWPLTTCVIRKPGELSLLSINKAKGLDSLAVIMIDTQSFDKHSNPQQQMDYFMGTSRCRQLLAILHRESSQAQGFNP